MSDKIQRLMMGTFLVVILYVVNIGEIMIASYLLGFMIAMVFTWALFDFCPSLWMLKKVFNEDAPECTK